VTSTPPADGPTYQVLALRYATHEERDSRDNFLHRGEHDTIMPIDYYVWVIRGPLDADHPRVIAVDTGMAADAPARHPGRRILLPVDQSLSQAGISSSEVRDVVITHMHYDHGGRLDMFPNATFHIQDAEMAFCTGRAMCHEVLRGAFDIDDVANAVRHVHSGRVRFHDGDGEIAPSVTVHLIGGHTGGLQVVRVPTSRGWVVLASDATHLWANIRTGNPFPIVADVVATVEGYRKLESLADGPDHIIPGHDPLVRTRFPRFRDNPEVVRLDLTPEE
jgi:glyoxylase-like metal-dependent hydrolase (beta-lactamase superfamily II)